MSSFRGARRPGSSGDDVASHAIKILMNSFYGVLGHLGVPLLQPGARPTPSPAWASEMLLWSKRWFEAAGFDVLYGDTDSLFVRSRGVDPDRARRTRHGSSPRR